jgi:3-oxoacyl-[acyl-carrier-protein] synthase II
MYSPIGNSADEVSRGLRCMASGVKQMQGWAQVDGLQTRLAAVLPTEPDLSAIPRHTRRGMGRQALLAALAARDAAKDAVLEHALLQSGRVGLAIGSTIGSQESLYTYYEQLIRGGGIRGIKSTAFLQVMSHTCAANVALDLGITGRVLAPVSACTSSSQCIGIGFETICVGAQDVMICGGADEAHFTAAATFDVVGGASRRYNEQPELTPRPFDRERDGLVVGEGSGIVVLERLEHALARGATIYGEILGYATNCNGSHITQPEQQAIEACLRLALSSAGLAATDVDYINAHATATVLGDTVEARAITTIFGDRVPVSSTKGQTGHTLGACGALETIFCLLMINGGFVAGTRNLDQIDPDCAGPQHLLQPQDAQLTVAMNNNFAFGGVNTSIILGRFSA